LSFDFGWSRCLYPVVRRSSFDGFLSNKADACGELLHAALSCIAFLQVQQWSLVPLPHISGLWQ